MDYVNRSGMEPSTRAADDGDNTVSAEMAATGTSAKAAPGLPRRAVRRPHRRRQILAVVAALLIGGALIGRARMHQNMRNQELVDAALTGRTTEVRRLLEQGADPNARDGFRSQSAFAPRTFSELMIDLWRRARGGKPRSVKPSLLPPNALVNAAWANDAASIELLLRHGADPDAPNGIGDTALIAACTGDPGRPTGASDRMVRALIAGGARVDLGNRFGDTALLRAADAGESASAVLLIDHGADVNAQHPRTKETALAIARRRNDAHLTTVLLRRGAQR